LLLSSHAFITKNVFLSSSINKEKLQVVTLDKDKFQVLSLVVVVVLIATKMELND
jgi:hypothetical protein